MSHEASRLDKALEIHLRVLHSVTDSCSHEEFCPDSKYDKPYLTNLQIITILCLRYLLPEFF
jgi:hypothetical protein